MILINDESYTLQDFINLTETKKELKYKIEVIDNTNVHIFSYKVAMPDTFETPIHREFRGIVFDDSGRCICRPFHKFFNVNENESVHQSKIDWKNLLHISVKNDGSLITPVLINNKIFFKSKKSFHSEVVKLFLQEYKIPDNVLEFIKKELRNNKTPMFEYCTPNNQIVLKYKQPEFLYIYSRDMYTGKYEYNWNNNDVTYKSLFGIDFTTLNCIKTIKNVVDIEGFVIQDKNDFYKIKTDWYLARHHALSEISYKEVIKMILNETIDDVISYVNDYADEIDVIGDKLKIIESLVKEINGDKLSIIKFAEEEVDWLNNKYSNDETSKWKHIQEGVDTSIQPFVFRQLKNSDYELGLNKFLYQKYKEKYAGKIIRFGILGNIKNEEENV